MANSEAADMMAIGRHCANPACGQIDFLPFPCSGCGKVYCLEHRVCPCSEANRDTVLVCPLCARAVIVPPGENENVVFDRHQRVECDPSNYARVHKKPRCPAPGCKEKLTSTNKYLCKDCGTEVCLKHRFPADHRCPGKVAAAAAAQGRLGSSLQGIRRMFSSGGGGGAAAAAAAAPAKQGAAAGTANGSRRTVGQKAAAAASKTKDSIQSQLVQYRDRHRSYTGGPEGGGGAAEVVDLTSSPAGRAPRGASAGAAAGAGPEVCQQCGSRFATVQQLIQHAESAHAGGWSSGNVNMQQPAAGAGGLERCPYCTFSSADPVQLVAHVQQRHRAEAGASTGGSTCVLC